MAEIVMPKEQIRYVTEDVVSAANNVQLSAEQFDSETKPFTNSEYIKALRSSIDSALQAAVPVELDQPTGPYIEGLLQKRKELEQFEGTIRSGKIPSKPEDEEGDTVAINMYQRFSLAFMGLLVNFEEGLSPEQRW